MKSIRQILLSKAGKLVTATPDESVFSALEKMSTFGVGALLVMDGERLAGIFSERDYARKVALAGKHSKETTVGSIMTEKVLYVTPDHQVTQCLGLMTEKHIRHLPVIEDNKVVGIVSIGDLVKEKIAEQTFIIEQLERYITS
jgi:CBS domain-containing protein